MQTFAAYPPSKRKRDKMAKEKEDDKDKKKKPDLDDDTPLTKLFLRRFIANLKKLAPEKDINDAMKKARGSAGGTMKNRKRKTAGEGAAEFDDFEHNPVFRPKKSKAIAKYRAADDGATEMCNGCLFWIHHACNLVEGTILPDDVCDLFEVKLALFHEANVADLCAGGRDSGNVLLFNELPEQFAEPPEWIPFLPKPGEYNSPKYGDIFITRERNENFIRNFEDGVYQESLPISSEHIDADQDGAYGWIEEMRMNEDGSVDAKVTWTDRGTEAIENDRFRYFSPEFHDVYKDNKEEIHKDVAVGGALTTRPFFKEDELRPLVASDGVLTFSEGESSITFTTAAHRRRLELQMSAQDSGDTGTPKPTAFEKFKEGLTSFIANFKEDAEPASIAPTGDPAPKDEPVTASDDGKNTVTDADRVATLEAENAALKARETRDGTDLKTANERIALLEVKDEVSTFTEIVLGEGNPEGRWFGKVENHVKHMRSLKKAFGEDSEELKHYIASQKAQVTAMNTAGLFDERGSDFGADASDAADTPTGALAQMKAMAEKLVSEAPADAPITIEQAMVRISKENPDLKKKHREQFRSRDTVR